MPKGTRLYAGLPVFPNNNVDLNYIYRIGYAAKAANQSPTQSAFAQLRSTYGQVRRFLISVRVVQLGRICEEGAFFGSLSHEVPELFFNFFNIHAAASTLAQKATHCSIIYQHGMRFFKPKGMEIEAAKLDELLQYVKGVQSNAKAEDRIAVAHRSIEGRVEQKKFLFEDDMQLLRRRGLEALHSVCGSIQRVEREEGKEAALDFLKSREGLVAKYSINFVAVMVLTGDGQRPQVYSSPVLNMDAEREPGEQR